MDGEFRKLLINSMRAVRGLSVLKCNILTKSMFLWLWKGLEIYEVSEAGFEDLIGEELNLYLHR